MNDYKRYGIKPGQVYVPADGSHGALTVRDVETFADVDDVVVYDDVAGKERRIDAFKLSNVRYCLVDVNNVKNRRELLSSLNLGAASPAQQRQVADLCRALQAALDEQAAHAQRGRFIVDNGEWRRDTDPHEEPRSWLCVQVASHADLSCKGTRALALDAAIQKEAT